MYATLPAVLSNPDPPRAKVGVCGTSLKIKEGVFFFQVAGGGGEGGDAGSVSGLTDRISEVRRSLLTL